MSQLASLTESLTGRYSIEREIGRGGMATVYLARDARHERQVAIKVLDPELGAVLGAERFLSEIRVTANLQHPNLLPLFDSGEAAGNLFYVMPFVMGETLRSRLYREKQLPVDEAIRIAVAIANALDYAHAHGVIHRDLKPENILMQAGQPIVADFGIALAVSKAGGQRVTQTGLSLGTPQYMSPEQATGDRSVDGRTDIYSLGALTYEMLTGEPPHAGSTAQAVIAKLMTEDPRPITVLRRSVPPYVDAAVRCALEKLPADRFATAGEFAAAMQGRSLATTARYGLTPSPHPRATRWLRVVASGATAAALLLALGLAATLLRTGDAPEAPVVRTTLDLQPGERLLSSDFVIVVSPAGDRVAYVTQGPGGIRTMVRRSDELTSRELVKGSMRSVTFSPDGRWIAYVDGASLRKVPSDGGSTVDLGSSPLDVTGLAWLTPDLIVLGTSAGLWTVSAAGGQPRRLSWSDSARGVARMIPLADGKRILYLTGAGTFASSQVMLASLDQERVDTIGLHGVRPVGLIDGQLIYQTEGATLMAVAFDAERRRLDGVPVAVAEMAMLSALSASGTLAYLPAQSGGRLVLASNASGETPVMDEARQYFAPRFSPDGGRIAVVVEDASQSGNVATGDIWVYDIAGRTFRQLTTGGGYGVPEWNSDGTRILFRGEAPTGRRILWQPADGSAPAEPLLETRQGVNEAFISPDGKWLIYRTAPGSVMSRDIFAVELTGDRTPVPLVTGPSAEQMPRLSPDGRWLAYQSDETGRFEIYIRPFPNPGARIKVTTSGGSEPLWARSGDALIYRTAEGVMAMDVTSGATLSLGARRLVLSGDFITETTHASYDVSPDGMRYLMVKPVGDRAAPVVVHNWVRELRARVEAGVGKR